jgi:hypothetical protein
MQERGTNRTLDPQGQGKSLDWLNLGQNAFKV